MATYISRTPSSSGNRRKFTISMWVKRIKLGVDSWLVQAGASGSEFDIRFTTSDTLRFSTWDGSNGYGMITTRVFRDTSAWMHLVFQYDSAQATDTNRNKIYVNGEQISPSDTSAYNAGKHPPQDYDNPSWNNTAEFRINDVTWTSSSAKDALYTHIHHTDGYAYDASTFGETDSTSGIWKPKTSPSVTYGTNGFFLKFENSGNLDLDSSGNNLTFTTSGTLTQNVDTPSNVFATLNVLASTTSQNEFQYGNLEHYGTSNWTGAVTTLGASSGKYYAEVKVTDRDNFSVGIVTLSGTAINNINTNNNGKVGKYVDSWGIEGSGSNLYKGNNGSSSSYGSGFSNNDIAMIALDVGTGSNGAVYFGKNGTWFDSGNPATGSNPAFSSLSFSDAVGFMSGLETGRVQWNFGQGYFGTTQVASANADANGHGKMEYAVPTGYYTLNTKNLKEFG